MVWRLVVGGAGMICAWFLIHTVLALHYAHLYYGDVTAGGKTVDRGGLRSEEHTSELQSLMRISYAVFCLKKTTDKQKQTHDYLATALTNHHSCQSSGAAAN